MELGKRFTILVDGRKLDCRLTSRRVIPPGTMRRLAYLANSIGALIVQANCEDKELNKVRLLVARLPLHENKNFVDVTEST